MCVQFRSRASVLRERRQSLCECGTSPVVECSVWRSKAYVVQRIRMGLNDNDEAALEDCPEFETDKASACSLRLRFPICFLRAHPEQVWARNAVVIRRQGRLHRVHARRTFFGSPRYDFVEIRGSTAAAGDLWFGRVLALFDVNVSRDHPRIGRGWVSMALVQWLARDPQDQVAGVPTFSFTWGAHPDAVFVDQILRPVALVTSPVVPDDGHRRYFYVALPN